MMGATTVSTGAAGSGYYKTEGYYLEGSKDLISDWTAPISCGNYNTKTKTCVGAQAEE